MSILDLLAAKTSELGSGFVAAEGEVGFFAAIEADDVGEEADLRGRPLAVGAVHLAVDVTGIDEAARCQRGACWFAMSKNHNVQGSVTV